jgi:hypothetical protein
MPVCVFTSGWSNNSGQNTAGSGPVLPRSDMTHTHVALAESM